MSDNSNADDIPTGDGFNTVDWSKRTGGMPESPRQPDRDDEFYTLFTRSIQPGLPPQPAQPGLGAPIHIGAQLPSPPSAEKTAQGPGAAAGGAAGGVPSIGIGTRLTDDDMLDLTVQEVHRIERSPTLVVCGPNATSGGWCALKLLDPQFLDRLDPVQQQALRHNFEEEALNWCRLWPHPFILLTAGLTRLLVPGRTGLVPALVMEYAAQGTLADRLDAAYRARDAEPIALDLAFAWAQQIAIALNTVHTPDVTRRRDPQAHADVKPGNVVLTGDVARLSDFGLTRSLATLPSGVMVPQTVVVSPSATYMDPPSGAAQSPAPAPAAPSSRVLTFEHSTRVHRIPIRPDPTEPEIGSRSQVAGTPPYMSPEHWRGTSEIRTASDIYSFGVLLFELFAGMPATPHIPSSVGAFFGDPLAWFRAHKRGQVRHLTDADLPALTRGPLADLARRDPAQAQAILKRLDHLVEWCLAADHAARPTAVQLVNELAAIATAAGVAPVRTPPAFPRIPQNEAAFWSNLSSTYAHIEQLGAALDLAERAAERNRIDPHLRFAIGKLHAANRQYDDALAAYAQAELLLTAQQLAWGNPITYMLPKYQGVALMNLDRFPEAIAAFQRSLARRADSATTCFNLATAYFHWASDALDDPTVRRFRLERALQAAQDAQRIAPHFVRAKQLQEDIEHAVAGW